MTGQNQSGYVAILSVLIVSAASLAIALGLLLSGADSQRSVLAVQQAAQARNVAAACVDEALQVLHDNMTYTGSGSLASVGQGSCTYTVANPGGTTRTVDVTGTVGGIVSKVKVSSTVVATGVSVTSWQEVPVITGTPATIAFVQVRSQTPQTPQSVVDTSFNTSQTAGNMNVVAVGWSDTTTTVSSVTDTAGNTYQVAAPRFTANGMTQVIYYAKNINAAAPGNVVRVTLSGAAPFVDTRILEYSGLDQSNPLDVTTASSGTGLSASTGNVTTTAPSELLFAAGMTSRGFTAAGTNYTLRILTSINTDIAEDRIVTSAGSYNATATLSPDTAQWILQLVTFKATGQ